MELEFTYTFDTAFIRTALRRDFFWKVYLVIGLLAAIPIIHRLWAGMFDPYVIGIAALGIVFVSVRLTLAFRKGAERVFELWSKQSPDHTIRYRLGPEGFEVLMPNGMSRYEWSGLRRLWRYPDVWILEIVKNMSVFFPPDAASEEAREYVVERCRSANVRV